MDLLSLDKPILTNTIAAVYSFIAPFIGGALAQYVGYRPLFVLSLGIALFALFVSLRLLRAGRGTWRDSRELEHSANRRRVRTEAQMMGV